MYIETQLSLPAHGVTHRRERLDGLTHRGERVEYAFAIGEGPLLTLDDLTPELRGEPPPREGDTDDPRAAERARIVDALKKTGGRKGKAAGELGMSRSTLWRKLREYRIA